MRWVAELLPRRARPDCLSLQAVWQSGLQVPTGRRGGRPSSDPIRLKQQTGPPRSLGPSKVKRQGRPLLWAGGGLAHVAQAPGELMQALEQWAWVVVLSVAGDIAAGQRGQDDLELMQRATRTRSSGAIVVTLPACGTMRTRLVELCQPRPHQAMGGRDQVPLPPSAVASPSDYHSARQASCTRSSNLSCQPTAGLSGSVSGRRCARTGMTGYCARPSRWCQSTLAALGDVPRPSEEKERQLGGSWHCPSGLCFCFSLPHTPRTQKSTWPGSCSAQIAE